jgi:hypothetical protein
MLGELLGDSRRLTGFNALDARDLRSHKDVASTSMIEVWIEQTERRTWFWRRSSGGRSHRRKAKISAGVTHCQCAPANSGHHKSSSVPVVAPPLRN